MAIEGELQLEGLDAVTTVAALRIRLLDVSRADASSITVSETLIDNATMRPGEPISFSLDVPADLGQRNDYSVSAHADVDGSGDITVGDYLTMASNPVAVDGTQGPITVVLRRVTS